MDGREIGRGPVSWKGTALIPFGTDPTTWLRNTLPAAMIAAKLQLRNKT